MYPLSVNRLGVFHREIWQFRSYKNRTSLISPIKSKIYLLRGMYITSLYQILFQCVYPTTQKCCREHIDVQRSSLVVTSTRSSREQDTNTERSQYLHPYISVTPPIQVDNKHHYQPFIDNWISPYLSQLMVIIWVSITCWILLQMH